MKLPIKLLTLVCIILLSQLLMAQQKSNKPREHLLLDKGWSFAFGHPYNTAKDFDTGTGYFSYLTKAGYGDGAAATDFDDRAWRKLDLPHDWAVEQAFNPAASFSHGFKAVGRDFPETSIGWYRKTIQIPETDLGRKISIAFDGISRNAMVWVNGHYLGTESSGYLGFEYDITDYLVYGGENVIAVRADVTMEEGWYYEGAGIYRHTWLNKTQPLHVSTNGTFVTAAVKDQDAILTVATTIKNDHLKAVSFSIKQQVLNADGKILATAEIENLNLAVLQEKDFSVNLPVPNAHMWSLDDPYLHRLSTTIVQNGKITDIYETNFGIRTVRFDADKGFFLNGKPVKIKGTNNHQDHAGLGVALPDALQYFRINTLKQMGSNAYRCAHHPPSPELLEACDRLGMLVIDEHRLMGITHTHLNDLKRMILRDRNHPSIISWSVGNEEWKIEGDIAGARIAATMQAFAKTIDTTRAITAAISGGVGVGISTTIDLLGYNYIAQKNTDEHHLKFPKQMSWGTEEGSTVTTRGIYKDDLEKHYLAAYDKKQNDHFLSLEDGWKYYANRPYLAGMFIWTGFDYRGEPTPFGWPSVTSYFGMTDICGFPKDYAWYLKSWWKDLPVLHLFPHWNWNGAEGNLIDVWAYSNCDEVEVFLNGKSMGRKKMDKNGHLQWKVQYAPGTLTAIGYKNEKKIATDVIKTTTDAIQVAVEFNAVKFPQNDIAVLTLSAQDKNGLRVPTADHEIELDLQGPARIIGVGNGDPVSLEPDQFLDRIDVVQINNLKERPVAGFDGLKEVAEDYDTSSWLWAFKEERNKVFGEKNKILVYRGTFEMPVISEGAKVTYFLKNIGKEQSVYINGKLLAKGLNNPKGDQFILEKNWLKTGINTIAIVARPLLKNYSWEQINSDPGVFQIISPAAQWKRKLFNGLAQVIIQFDGAPGKVSLKASSKGLKPTIFNLRLN